MTTQLTFDEYRRNANPDSDAWATTNRGWAWTGEDRSSGRCFAHYLDYERDNGHGKRIHVVLVRDGQCGIMWVRTCEEARLAIRAAFRRHIRAQRWHDQHQNAY